MAGLRNSNGQVVIDKNEALNEIRNIKQVKAKLVDTRKLLDPSRLDDAHMQGDTRNALSESLRKISGELKSGEDICNFVSTYIESTVAKYERIDREYARKLKESRGK